MTVKIPTTRQHVTTGDLVDGERVTEVQHRTGDNGQCETRLHFKRAGGWGPWLPSVWHISVWR